MVAPIILFGFNRPDVFESTLTSLKNNPLADESDLYIFIDGPRCNNDIEKINQVRQIAERVDGFKAKQIIISEKNKGLAKSIISGTTEIINKYGRAIVLEDDLYLSPSFLTFMNTMLDAYEKDERVFQISGFGTKVKIPIGYKCEYYLNTRAQSWSWATWRDRWNSVDWEVKNYEAFKKDFNKQKQLLKSGSDLVEAIRAYKEKRADIWFICFMYNMFCQGKYSINPIRSLVRNDGFRPDSTHTKNYNRYKIDFNDSFQNYEIPTQLEWNKELNTSAVRYWSIRYRLIGKIMTFLRR